MENYGRHRADLERAHQEKEDREKSELRQTIAELKADVQRLKNHYLNESMMNDKESADNVDYLLLVMFLKENAKELREMLKWNIETFHEIKHHLVDSIDVRAMLQKARER